MAHKFFVYLLRNQIILALFIVVVGWFLFQTRGILTSIFLAYIINAALLPIVRILRKRGLSNFLSALIPFVSILFLLVLVIFPIFPFVFSQVTSLLVGLPEYLNEAGKILGFQVNAEQIQGFVTREVDSIGRNAFSVTSRVFGGLFSILTVLIVSFYMILYHDKFKDNVAEFFHKKQKQRVIETLDNVDDKLGAWLTGQLVLSLVIGLVTWIALSILGIPYALPLAILAGMLEIVPTLGPIIASIPAIIVALTVSPTLALVTVVLYIVIQLLENNILVPKIMQRAVGLNPVVVILAVMIGANLMGVIGALLSIPFVSFIIVLFNSITREEDN
jgi:predicted PurR-regulated permease PerM